MRSEKGSGGVSEAIDTRDLTKRFGDFTAVDQVTFDVQAGCAWLPRKSAVLRCRHW